MSTKQYRLVIRALTMRSILLLVLLSSEVYSEKSLFLDLPALNPDHHVRIGEKYISEIGCLKKLDGLLKEKWAAQLNKISTMDLGNLGKVWWQEKDSSYVAYNTYEEEWLMNNHSPPRRIEACFRNLVSDVVPLMSQAEKNCLNELFYFHVVDEIDREEEFQRILEQAPRDQLPFRQFISFSELVEILFQNRSPDTMTDLERVLYEHADSYLNTDEDRVRRSYTGSQDCDWVNARALREVSGEKAKFEEFKSQVRRSLNKQLAGHLIKNWNLNATIPIDTYERWLKARQAMLPRLEKEVKKLKKQRKDVQWLCEYATRLAFELSEEQTGILLTEDRSWVHLEVSDVASKARVVEKALGKLNDFRHGAIKMVADQYEEGTRCLSSFLHLVQNHRRYDLATAFIDEHYTYPELFCREKIKDFGLVQMNFCNCKGSFCIVHPLAALFADEYVISQGSDGTYQVVRSGNKSKRKVTHCHVLANSNKIV